MAKRVVPPVGRFGGVGEIRKRLRGSQIIYDNRDGLATEMLGIAKAKVTDIFDWNGKKLELKDAKDIPDHALAAIKKIKITPTQSGEDVIEVELLDKVRVFQLLAKSAGLLDTEKDGDKPAVVDIQMVMPEGDADEEK
tara:strand:+ start:1757 stop:2170 length:414 start_codon:yes stop_codon:yes gene_type:complete